MGKFRLDQLLEDCTVWIWKALKVRHFSAKTGKLEISKVFISTLFWHFSMPIIVLSYCYMNWSEIDMINVAELMAVFLIFSRECFYCFLLYVNWQELKDLLETVVSDRKYVQKYGSDEQLAMTLKYNKMEVQAMITYLASIMVSDLLSNALVPFLCPNEFCTLINCHWTYLPVENYQNLNWVINYLHQATSCTVAAYFFAAYLSMSLVLMHQTCWLIDSTILSLKQFDKLLSMEAVVQYDNEVNDSFNDIVQKTWSIINWQRKVQNLMKYSFLSEISLLSTVFCMTIFTLSVNMTGSFVALLVFLVNFSQFFLYCWMGSEYTGRIEELSNTLFGLSWDKMKPYQRRSLKLVILMSQNMQGFSGIFMKMDFGTLTKVINLSYSLLAVVKSTSTQP